MIRKIVCRERFNLILEQSLIKKGKCLFQRHLASQSHSGGDNDYVNFMNNWISSTSANPSTKTTTKSQSNPALSGSEQHELYEKQMMELKQEREELFGFTDDEKQGWINSQEPNDMTTKEIMKQVIQKRNQIIKQADEQQNDEFTHVSRSGTSVSMVDVGQKKVTRRIAKARSIVTFPPEVMMVFSKTSNELIGPKGPIFSTAKLAGIMGAKRTSELIPLCHPLPLDKVDVNIELVDNQAVIDCECYVTHKTGVEMEALTGASIAALTIYDMVKAVSHRVEIKDTILVKKSGGKRNIDEL